MDLEKKQETAIAWETMLKNYLAHTAQANDVNPKEFATWPIVANLGKDNMPSQEESAKTVYWAIENPDKLAVVATAVSQFRNGMLSTINQNIENLENTISQLIETRRAVDVASEKLQTVTKQYVEAYKNKVSKLAKATVDDVLETKQMLEKLFADKPKMIAITSKIDEDIKKSTDMLATLNEMKKQYS